MKECDNSTRKIHINSNFVLEHPCFVIIHFGQKAHLAQSHGLCSSQGIFLVIHIYLSLFLYVWRHSRQWVMTSSFTRFLDHTQRRTTVGRTPLDKWSARSRDLYLTIYNTHNRQTSMPPVWFKPTISTGERPQTYALDRAATGTGICLN
jgi:hypothetical protein